MPANYIKGYKIDKDKLKTCFGTPEDDPYNLQFHGLVRLFPRESYKYLGAGRQLDGMLCLVLVLDDGNNKAKLENSAMPEFNQRGIVTIPSTLGLPPLDRRRYQSCGVRRPRVTVRLD
jgi:hypothetical protein